MVLDDKQLGVQVISYVFTALSTLPEFKGGKIVSDQTCTLYNALGLSLEKYIPSTQLFLVSKKTYGPNPAFKYKHVVPSNILKAAEIIQNLWQNLCLKLGIKA